MKWRDLEARGVHRCALVFGSGKRCRRRTEKGAHWCARHAWVERAIKRIHDAGARADRATHSEDDR